MSASEKQSAITQAHRQTEPAAAKTSFLLSVKHIATVIN